MTWGIRRRLDRIDARLAALTQLVRREGRQLMALIDDTLADVTAQTTVVQSAVTLLTSLSAQLAAAIASGDLKKVQAVKDAIDANTTALAQAVQANTPAAPPPAP